MSKMSVSDAAERLAVSPARIRQRIADGSLVAEKVGGRWLVDLEASTSESLPRGRPVAPASVWWSLLAAELARPDVEAWMRGAMPSVNPEPFKCAVMPAFDSEALERAVIPAFNAESFKCAVMPAFNAEVLSRAVMPAFDSVVKYRAPDAKAIEALLPRMRGVDLFLPQMNPFESHVGPDAIIRDIAVEVKRLSSSSRRRAVRRMADAIVARDHDALLAWLRNRGSRHLYVAADSDLEALKEDPRVVLSGLSHSASEMEDPLVVEGYVGDEDLSALKNEHWLDSPSLDDRPNVVLHAAPMRPAGISRLLLAADLAEHGGPRELRRAHELLDEEISQLLEREALA
jgi:excisionase family DNA binding protein